MFIRYKIEKVTPDSGQVIRLLGNRDRRLVSKKEYLKLKKEGFYLIRKKYLIISDLYNLWEKLTLSDKISISGIILTSMLAILLYYLSK